MKKTMTVLALTLRRRTLSTRTLLALLALLIPIWASAQSHGAHCTTPGQGGYIYSFTTPTGDAPQVDFDLYFNSDHVVRAPCDRPRRERSAARDEQRVLDSGSFRPRKRAPRTEHAVRDLRGVLHRQRPLEAERSLRRRNLGR